MDYVELGRTGEWPANRWLADPLPREGACVLDDLALTLVEQAPRLRGRGSIQLQRSVARCLK